MEKIESKITPSKDWVKEYRTEEPSYSHLISIIKAAQRQAIEATLEYIAENAQAYISVNNIPLIRKESVLSRINSPELKVI